jgi:hypothetical protein
MPGNAIYVGRPTKYGNPFRVGHPGPLNREPLDNEGAVGFFEDMLADLEFREAAGYPGDLSDLRGKDLACWCGPGEVCHADVLLKVANQ